MHTDEYEISLTREINVCRSTIARIRKTLELLERKHGRKTAAFIADFRAGSLPVDPDLKDDYDAWVSSYESLNKWEELERQYQEVYRSMKI